MTEKIHQQQCSSLPAGYLHAMPQGTRHPRSFGYFSTLPRGGQQPSSLDPVISTLELEMMMMLELPSSMMTSSNDLAECGIGRGDCNLRREKAGQVAVCFGALGVVVFPRRYILNCQSCQLHLVALGADEALAPHPEIQRKLGSYTILDGRRRLS